MDFGKGGGGEGKGEGGEDARHRLLAKVRFARRSVPVDARMQLRSRRGRERRNEGDSSFLTTRDAPLPRLLGPYYPGITLGDSQKSPRMPRVGYAPPANYALITSLVSLN